jgi:class 3 adenylate cyclase/tetratricopeptide (TPR) repeat protein
MPAQARVGPYLPDLVRRWPVDAPAHRRVEGALVSADISGFTALSERLATYGREGAEELTILLNRCFGGMIEIIEAHGGDVLKFGGDALLVLFTGEEHTARAAASCVEMRHLIQRTWSTSLVKRIELGISQGVHAGTFDLHLVDAGHRELLVVGAGMSATVNCEGAAERGQILLSDEAAAQLEPSVLGEKTAAGRVLDSTPTITSERSAGPAEFDVDIEPYVPAWLVDQASAGRVAEHRTVTVGFVFFGGVDTLMAEQGPAVVHERLQALATAIELATSHHGVYWLASDVYAGGGKIILTAGAPRSTGQDEDAAVRTARELLAADVGLPLRVGLNRGPVFMGDLGSDRRRTFTVMGDTVNLAARLMQKSAPGQLVASEAVLELVPTRFELEVLEPFTVKGKAEPINASLVGAQLGDDQPEPSPSASDRDIPFVGRESEMTILGEQLTRARSGHGRIVDVVGNPGIGKTRTATELQRRNTDITVLHATGGLYSRRSPYFAVSIMLRRLAGIDRSASPATAGRLLSKWVADRAPEIVPSTPLLAIAFGAEVPMTRQVERIDPANRVVKLREAVIDLLTAVLVGPVMFVVDDAHRLDEASEELFAAIGRRIARRSWLLLALRWRDHESFVDDAADVVNVDIGPLTTEDADAIARSAVAADDRFDDDDLDDLIERGATNPLFLLELVRAGIGREAATPASIESLVTARIDTLSASDRLLLREAAVLGSVIDINLLAEATGTGELRNPERWTSLSGFLTRSGNSLFHFNQGLYREVAYEGLSFGRRRQIHADVGNVIERRAGEDWATSSELLSLHFHEARQWTRSWRYSVIAGDRAQSKYAPAEAADFYGRALAVPAAHRPEPAAVSAVAESLADALELNGQFGRAGEALTLARRTRSDADGLVRLMLKEGVIRERLGKYTQALRWYGRALSATAELEGSRAKAAEGELALAYAGVRWRQGRIQDTITWAHRAEAIADELDDLKMLAHSSYLLLIGYGVARRPEVARYRTVPLRLYEQVGDLVGQANVLNNLGVDAHDESRWAEALDYYERSRVAREEAGDVIGAATATNNIAEILSDQGHLDEAEPLFEEALRAWRRAGYEVGLAVATSYLGRLHARRGDFETARRMLADAVDRFEAIGASHFVLETNTFQLECEVLAGNGREAAATSGPIFELAAEIGDPLLEAMLLRNQAWAHYAADEFDEAEDLASRCLSIAEAIGAFYEVALALILQGQIHAATGGDHTVDDERARSLLQQLGVVSPPQGIGAPLRSGVGDATRDTLSR